MSARYFSDILIEGASCVLTGAEAQHLARVMRAKPGDEVLLFDGSGAEFEAVIDSVERGRLDLSIRSRREVNREARVRLTLGVALPKGDRQRWLVEKAVELGVAELTPLVTARGVAQPTSGALDRLRKAVIEASKQCGRNRLLQVTEPQGLASFVTAAPASSERWLAHPGQDPPAGERVDTPSAPGERPILAAVGPEGGFTDDEAQLALAAGWRRLDLGPRILRTETAAVALAARLIR